jgi:hypothetical protein
LEETATARINKPAIVRSIGRLRGRARFERIENQPPILWSAPADCNFEKIALLDIFCPGGYKNYLMYSPSPPFRTGK